MKRSVLKLFGVFISCVILFASYAKFKGIYDWAPWYMSGEEILEFEGEAKSVKWRSGKGSCHCWVIRASGVDKVISFYTYEDSYTGDLPKVDGGYFFKYQLSPNQENRPVGIYSLKSGDKIYKAESYAGLGLAVISAVAGTLFLLMSLLLFMVSFGRFDKYITYPE